MRIPHDSKLIQATTYDPATQTLHIELLHKGTYVCHDVPAEDVASLRGATSIGAHFNATFKAAHGHKMKKVS